MTRREADMVAEAIIRKLKDEGLVEDKVIGIDEVAEIMGCSPRTVSKHLDDLPHTKVGRQARFFRSDIFKMLKR